MENQLERLKAALADRYKIEREIGEGGMATVFLAEDLTAAGPRRLNNVVVVTNWFVELRERMGGR